MKSLYPAVEPYNHFMIKVTPPHELYVEECGNPDGLPVVFIHGGPGNGSSADDRRFFDPKTYRIILFDQRGCGRSAPLACLENNTTQDSIQDIEAIREKLGIDSWVVFGGSWGSTLSIAYAQAHPDRTKALILRGIFLATHEEIQWAFQEGMGQFFPEAYETFRNYITPDKQDDLISAYYELMTGDNEQTRLEAATVWAKFEAHCCFLEPQQTLIDYFDDAHAALGIATLECHYMVNDCFFEPNQLIDNMHKIADIPTIMVQGRYDIICTPQAAWDVRKALPNAKLLYIPDAGHASRETGTAEQLVKATQTIAEELTIR